jgi:hypothetical protein
MQKISEFLEKFKTFGVKEREEKEKIIKIIEEFAKVTLNNKSFDFKDNKIILKLSGTPKTEIILNKNKILVALNKEGILVLNVV